MRGKIYCTKYILCIALVLFLPPVSKSSIKSNILLRHEPKLQVSPQRVASPHFCRSHLCIYSLITSFKQQLFGFHFRRFLVLSYNDYSEFTFLFQTSTVLNISLPSIWVQVFSLLLWNKKMVLINRTLMQKKHLVRIKRVFDKSIKLTWLDTWLAPKPKSKQAQTQTSTPTSKQTQASTPQSTSTYWITKSF